MEFGILGPVQVTDHGERVAVGQPQVRGVLGMLLLNANNLVTAERLIDLVWGRHPSASARASLHNRIATLRLLLRVPGVALVTTGRGYRLEVEPAHVDAQVFAGLARDARADRDPAERMRKLDAALALWRGPLLVDVIDDDARAALGASLDELRLAAFELRAETALQLGRHRHLIDELVGVVAAYPSRERLVGSLMTAYARSGRLGEALTLYRSTVHHLDAELGIWPGPELAALHVELLRSNGHIAGRATLVDRPVPAQQVEAGGRPGVSSSWAVARQLPPEPVDFVGREAELTTLDELLVPGTVVLLGGLGGVGKTTLALRWAHDAVSRFPDGQLWLDLRGGGPGQPVSAADALGQLLRSIGSPYAVPAREHEASQLFRSLVAGRRLLLLLDDAASAGQVRPLLPSAPTCVTLITSRRMLPGLVALDGAKVHRLEALRPPESAALMRQLLGPARVDAEVRTADRLAALVGHLPLALRIATALLVVSSRRPIGDLVAALDGDALGPLTVDDDPQASVRAVFEHSYRRLAPVAQRMFRLLGAAPGPDAGSSAAAALLGESDAVAADALRRLVDAHLVIEHAPGRYRMHDLVRAYAAQRLADEPPQERSAAVLRILDWYADHARSAVLAYAMGHPLLRRAERPAEPMAVERAATMWLETELTNVVAAICAAPPHRDAWRTCLMADALRTYLVHIDYGLSGWLAIADAARAAAEELGDPHALIAAELSFGGAYEAAGRYEAALDHLGRAADLARDHGWSDAQWQAVGDTGRVLNTVGRHREAIGFCLAAAAGCRSAGVPRAAARHLINVTVALERLGRLDEMAATLTTVLVELGPHCSTAAVRIIRQNLACAYLLLGRLDQGLALVGQVLGEIGTPAPYERYLWGCALETLAAIRRDQGRLPVALDAADRSVAALSDLRSPSLADAVITRSSILLQIGRTPEAVVGYRQALDLAHQSATTEALACAGLADAALAEGNRADARMHAEQALSIARRDGLRIVEGMALDVLARAATDPVSAAQYAAAADDVHRSTGYRRHVG